MWITPAVANELDGHPDAPALASIRAALASGKLRVPELSREAESLLSTLRPHVDPGEAESIAVAASLEGATLLIDERKGRRLAAERGIDFAGLLGALLLAKKRGLIASVSEIIGVLREKASFFVFEPLEEMILKAAGESEDE